MGKRYIPQIIDKPTDLDLTWHRYHCPNCEWTGCVVTGSQLTGHPDPVWCPNCKKGKMYFAPKGESQW